MKTVEEFIALQRSMQIFEEFLDLQRSIKRDAMSVRKIRKPNEPYYEAMPHIQIDSVRTVASITGMDPYVVNELMINGEWDNPIVHQAVLDLFMGLKLTYQGGVSPLRRSAEQITKSNSEKKENYDQKLAEFHRASDLRKNPSNVKMIIWFREQRERIAGLLNDGQELSTEDTLLVKAIFFDYNQMVIINDEYQPQVILSINPSFPDIVRIMRKARRLYSETLTNARS